MTRPRHEKKFAALLAAQRIEHFLPLIGSVCRYGSREVTFTKPLFPGYVFVQVGADRKCRVMNRDHLARAIAVEDDAKFLRQLEDVRRIVASGLELSVHPLVQCGTRVRVVSGPLRGLEGVVADAADAGGIVFAVDIIQHGLLVKMPLADLRPLP